MQTTDAKPNLFIGRCRLKEKESREKGRDPENSLIDCRIKTSEGLPDSLPQFKYELLLLSDDMGNISGSVS